MNHIIAELGIDNLAQEILCSDSDERPFHGARATYDALCLDQDLSKFVNMLEMGESLTFVDEITVQFSDTQRTYTAKDIPMIREAQEAIKTQIESVYCQDPVEGYCVYFDGHMRVGYIHLSTIGCARIEGNDRPVQRYELVCILEENTRKDHNNLPGAMFTSTSPRKSSKGLLGFMHEDNAFSVKWPHEGELISIDSPVLLLSAVLKGTKSRGPYR